MKPAVKPLAASRRIVFRNERGVRQDAFAQWRDHGGISHLYDCDGDRANFHADFIRHDLPGAVMAQFDCAGLTYTRDVARARADGHDDVNIQLNLQGGRTGRMGERDVVAGAGTALLIDTARPTLNRSVHTRGVLFSLPRDAFEGRPLDGLHGEVVSGPAFRRLRAFVDWLVHGLPQAPAEAAARTQASLARVALATFRADAEPELQHSCDLDGLTVTRLRALACAPTGAGDAATLAARLNVSRAALYRATASYGGVMELVWEERLQAAHAALCDPARTAPIGDLALGLGFASPHHFSRRFRERFGLSPSDLRPFRLERPAG